MTDLSKLKVSLTKEGAHKSFYLLRDLAVADVLDSVLETSETGLPGVNIDRAQTANILSAAVDGTLPPIWQSAKSLSEDALKHLVFLAIVFSHHKLIQAFQVGAINKGIGALKRGDVLGGKDFSNIKNEISALGLSTSSSTDEVRYDLRPILASAELGELASSLIKLKLEKAGWAGNGPVSDEAVRLDFHVCLAQTDIGSFKQWLRGAKLTTSASEFVAKEFSFRPGHNEGKEGAAKRPTSKKPGSIALRHNELQNSLYRYLVSQHGEDCVGTELPPEYGDTSIDVVTKLSSEITFFEIKTASSMRLCIREALSQLMEYGFWPDANRADKLVIVAEAEATPDGRAYLQKLRDEFKLPVYYSRIDGKTGELKNTT